MATMVITCTHCQSVLLSPSFDAPQLHSGVHATSSNDSTLRIEGHTHYLSCMSSKGVETLASLTAPELREQEMKHQVHQYYLLTNRIHLLGRFYQKSQWQSCPCIEHGSKYTVTISHCS